MPASFFDTNVLVYLTSGDAAKAENKKAPPSERLLQISMP